MLPKWEQRCGQLDGRYDLIEEVKGTELAIRATINSKGQKGYAQ